MRLGIAGLLAAALLAGCGSGPPSAPGTPPGASPPESGAPLPSAGAGAPASRTTPSAGWKITVYYTAVEQFHGGDPEQVTGCPRLDCTNGDHDLGTYPAGFVSAVKTEGTGRTASGRYLNWSYDIGFWLDTAPRDTDGDPLEAYVSAAADPDVLAPGTQFSFADCGRQDDGSPTPAAVCRRFRQAHWRVDDQFTPGLGGSKHLDLYIGPETGPDFTRSDTYVTLEGVTVSLPA